MMWYIFFYCRDTVFCVHLQCIHYAVSLGSVYRACVGCEGRGLRIDRPIPLSPCGHSCHVYIWPTEIHVPPSDMLCSITCLDSNPIVTVCNNTLLHACGLDGRYIYIYIGIGRAKLFISTCWLKSMLYRADIICFSKFLIIFLSSLFKRCKSWPKLRIEKSIVKI